MVVRFLIKIIATDWPDQNNFDYLSTSESSNNSRSVHITTFRLAKCIPK